MLKIILFGMWCGWAEEGSNALGLPVSFLNKSVRILFSEIAILRSRKLQEFSSEFHPYDGVVKVSSRSDLFCLV